MSEPEMCCLCGKRKVMSGSSSASKSAQRVKICYQCYSTPGMRQKAAVKLGLPIFLPRGKGPKGPKSRAAKPPAQKRGKRPGGGGTYAVLDKVIAGLEELADEILAVADAVDGSAGRAEEYLVELEAKLGAFRGRSAEIRARLTAVEEKLGSAVKRLGESIPAASTPWKIP